MTEIVTISRRQWLRGAIALVAAPAIVRVGSLMPVSAPKRALVGFPGDWVDPYISQKVIEFTWGEIPGVVAYNIYATSREASSVPRHAIIPPQSWRRLGGSGKI